MAKQRKRPRSSNIQRKDHFLKILSHAVQNHRSIFQEPDQKSLRMIVYTLHCTCVGIRVRYDATVHMIGWELVRAFVDMTQWRDLISPEDFERGNLKYDTHVIRALERQRQRQRTSPEAEAWCQGRGYPVAVGNALHPRPVAYRLSEELGATGEASEDEDEEPGAKSKSKDEGEGSEVHTSPSAAADELEVDILPSAAADELQNKDKNKMITTMKKSAGDCTSATMIVDDDAASTRVPSSAGGSRFAASASAASNTEADHPT